MQTNLRTRMKFLDEAIGAEVLRDVYLGFDLWRR